MQKDKKYMPIIFFCFLSSMFIPIKALADIVEAKNIAEVALDGVIKNMALTKSRIDTLKQEISKLEQSKEDTYKQINLVKSDYAKSQLGLSEAIKQFKKYRIKQSIAQENYNKAQIKFNRIIGAIELAQLNTPPVLMVEHEDIKNAIRGIDILSSILPGVRLKAREYNIALAELNDSIVATKRHQHILEQALEKDNLLKEKLILLKQSLEKKHVDSTLKVSIQSKAMSDMADHIANLQNFLNRANSNISEREEKQKKLQLKERLQSSINFINLKGKLPFPIKGVLIQNGFNSHGAKRGETLRIIGTDYNVISPCKAIVEYAGEFRSLGKIAILDFGNDYHMVMIGFNKLFVEKNTMIGECQPIGTIQDNKQIYVELRYKSDIVDINDWWNKG